MSTRGAVIINNENGERAIGIYNHCDSNIHRGLGSTIFAFLRERSYTGSSGVQVRGIGDLAAQLVTELKKSSDHTGDVYIMGEGEEISCDVEYIYYITPSVCYPFTRCPTCGATITDKWEIKIIKDEALIFTGTPTEAIEHFGRNRGKPLF